MSGICRGLERRLNSPFIKTMMVLTISFPVTKVSQHFLYLRGRGISGDSLYFHSNTSTCTYILTRKSLCCRGSIADHMFWRRQHVSQHVSQNSYRLKISSYNLTSRTEQFKRPLLCQVNSLLVRCFAQPQKLGKFAWLFLKLCMNTLHLCTYVTDQHSTIIYFLTQCNMSLFHVLCSFLSVQWLKPIFPQYL